MGEHLFKDEWLVKALAGIAAVTPADVYRLRLQGQTYLGAALLKEGLLDRAELCRGVLLAYGLESVEPDAEADKFALGLVPEKVCRQREILPLRLLDESLVLAMADPTDLEAQAEAKTFSGRNTKVCFCPRDQLLRLMDGAYAAAAPARKPAAGPRLVLIADDDRDIRVIARAMLKTQGYRVEEATDGEAALEAVAARPPDLLILDLNMPGLGGFDVLRTLRAAPESRGLPVIMLTATPDRKVMDEAVSLGADDYVVKPFKPAQLAARVNALFRRLEY